MQLAETIRACAGLRRPLAPVDSSRRRIAGFIVQSLAGMVLVLLVAWPAFLLHFNLAAIGFIQLLVVLGIAIKFGFWQATIASVIANLCLNYLFVPPIFTFYIPDPQNWVALIVFEISALVVSRLSTQARAEAVRAASNEHELERLYDFSRMLLSLDRQTRGTGILSLVARMFAVEAAVLFDAAKTNIHSRGGDLEQLETQTRNAYIANQDSVSADRKTWVRVLRLGVRPIGAIGLQGNGLTAVAANAIASLSAIALERANSFERETQAEAERQSEQLRTTVLDALAHEYKTPLTAVRAAASGLMELGQLTPVQTDLISLIDSETSRLNELTTHLLQTSRLDGADLRVRPERIQIDHFVESLVVQAEQQQPKRTIRIVGSGSNVWIRADRELMAAALLQYLDNALKYSDPASVIDVEIQATPEIVRVAVRSAGPAITKEDRQRIFERFYRGPDARHRAAGTGIGLSITKKVAAVHQGRVGVISDEGAGNTFFLEVPRLKVERG